MKLKLKEHTKLIIMISSLTSILLVLFIAFNANRHINSMSQNNTELYSAFRISELMKSFRSNIAILESKQRGYLVTGDGKFLDEYRLRETETKTYLKSMEKYFSGKPEEETFYKLKDLTYKRLMELKDVSDNMAMPGTSAAEVPVVNSMADINATIDEINTSLGNTTAVLINNSVAYVKASRNWTFLEIAIGILAAMAAVVILFKDINIRNVLEHELRNAKKQADENALMKEQFMANMSHEIRTPMNAILGFAALMQKTTLNKNQEQYLAAIMSSSSNLLNIINDILDFSKIEAGKLRIEKISFDVHSLLQSLKIMFAQKAAEKGVAFEVRVDEKVPVHIFGDPTRLTQILVNLVNNAVKFTSQGSVTVSCGVKSIEHDVAQLVFRVKDTGIGIADDKIDLVFERFNQGNTETTRKYGGTGLGLSIVKDLVDIQDGEISVKSKEGLGSEFIVRISFALSFDEPVGSTRKEESRFEKFTGETKRVLLAEDNVLNQKLAATYLDGFGLQVDVAENGEAALKKLAQHTYNLVLMDIQMPVMDGYHAAQHIREVMKLNLPVIAMTAHIMKDEREKCMRYGMTDYISKPFKEEELYAMMTRYLGEKSGINKSMPLAGNPLFDGPPASAINLHELYQMGKGRVAFIKDMIRIFIEQNPVDIITLEEAIKRNDFRSIKALAHRMRTSVGFIGMKQLLEPLADMEQHAAAQNGMDEIKPCFDKVKSDCDAAVKLLTAELVKLGDEKILDIS